MHYELVVTMQNGRDISKAQHVATGGLPNPRMDNDITAVVDINHHMEWSRNGNYYYFWQIQTYIYNGMHV